LIKYILEDLIKDGSPMIKRATIVDKGKLSPPYEYLKDYVGVLKK
jgi:hypothetical protein